MSDYLANQCLDWDDEIQADGKKRNILLPDGDYAFTVSGFERGEHPGSAKLSRCKKAMLTLQVTTDAGTSEVRTDLFLHASMRWKLAAFFRSIGLMTDDTFKMDWSHVLGAKGKAHFKISTYTYKDKERQKNELAYFIDPAPASAVSSSEDDDDDDF